LGRARVLQEIRTMRFEEVYDRWTEARLRSAKQPICLGWAKDNSDASVGVMKATASTD
jgi:hypothetical protein